MWLPIPSDVEGMLAALKPHSAPEVSMFEKQASNMVNQAPTAVAKSASTHKGRVISWHGAFPHPTRHCGVREIDPSMTWRNISNGRDTAQWTSGCVPSSAYYPQLDAPSPSNAVTYHGASVTRLHILDPTGSPKNVEEKAIVDLVKIASAYVFLHEVRHVMFQSDVVIEDGAAARSF